MWTDEMYSEIQKGDTVYFKDASGSTGKGKAIMRGPAGWVVKSQYRGCLLYTSPSPRDQA